MKLNPAQQKAIDVLGAKRGRPEFKTSVGPQLRSALENGLGPLSETIDSGALGGRDGRLFLNKHTLGSVLGCERKFLAEQDSPFAWSPALARGTVSHKAVELAVNWPSDPNPLVLVDSAMERLAEKDRGIGEYLRSCSEVERAELRGEANQRVAKFLECFPPLKKAWRPVTEAGLRAELLGGRMVLMGKPDLMLGTVGGPDRADKAAAGKVIVDFKSGGFSPQHREDLRFYALLETLRLGVPPRLLATSYLDSGDLHDEDVTVDLLRAAVKRVVHGAHRYVELVAGGREPDTAPGPACWWCPAQPDCAEGTAHLRDRRNDDHGP